LSSATSLAVGSVSPLSLAFLRLSSCEPTSASFLVISLVFFSRLPACFPSVGEGLRILLLQHLDSPDRRSPVKFLLLSPLACFIHRCSSWAPFFAIPSLSHSVHLAPARFVTTCCPVSVALVGIRSFFRGNA
ncbi:hypothetical protein CSUI_001760, partial [Cystoisospora suis]